MRTVKLYHYTCRHSLDGIRETGLVYPAVKMRVAKDLPRPLERKFNMVGQLVWLTDLASITGLNRNMIGLTMGTLVKCDRTEHRFEVIGEDVPIFQWAELRVRWPVDIVTDLETLPGARPEHWFVSRGPVPVRYRPNHSDRTPPEPRAVAR